MESPEWDKEVHKILELSREIMVNQNLIFMFTLQKSLQSKLEAALYDKGDVSILGLVPAFREIGNFDLQLANLAVKKSLEVCGTVLQKVHISTYLITR